LIAADCLQGDPKDPETIAFEAKIKIEAEDLKLESFGVEVGLLLPLPTALLTISASTHYRSCVQHQGDQLFEVEEILRRRFPWPDEGKRFHGQGRLGIAR
jgi:hypothetical protein